MSITTQYRFSAEVTGMGPLDHPAFSAERRIRQLHESARGHGYWARVYSSRHDIDGYVRELKYAIDARKEARRIRERGHR